MSLSNSQYSAIMREYDRRQIEAKRQRDEHVREVERRIPALKELEAEIAALSLAGAKAALLKKDEEKERAKRQLKELREEREALLVGAGYPPDYMELSFACPLCHDTGYIGREKCRCFRKLEAAHYVEESNLKDVLDTENFEHFREDWYDNTRVLPEYQQTVLEHMRGVFRSCLCYAEEFSEKKGNLLLTGPAGTGKTFFTHCIAAYLLREGHGVIYVTATKMMDIVSGSRFDSEGRENAREERQRLYDCELLILDDLGTEWNNAFTNSELFSCLNERLREKKPCVISTNLSLQGLSERYSERVMSRLVGNYRILELVGNDLRLFRKW